MTNLPSPTRSVSHLCELPTELVERIVQLISSGRPERPLLEDLPALRKTSKTAAKDLKSLRLTCKRTCAIASPMLFRYMDITLLFFNVPADQRSSRLRQWDCRIQGITNSGMAKHVQSLKLAYLYAIPSFEESMDLSYEFLEVALNAFPALARSLVNLEALSLHTDWMLKYVIEEDSGRAWHGSDVTGTQCFPEAPITWRVASIIAATINERADTLKHLSLNLTATRVTTDLLLYLQSMNGKTLGRVSTVCLDLETESREQHQSNRYDDSLWNLISSTTLLATLTIRNRAGMLELRDKHIIPSTVRHLCLVGTRVSIAAGLMRFTNGPSELEHIELRSVDLVSGAWAEVFDAWHQLRQLKNLVIWNCNYTSERRLSGGLRSRLFQREVRKDDLDWKSLLELEEKTEKNRAIVPGVRFVSHR